MTRAQLVMTIIFFGRLGDGPLFLDELVSTGKCPCRVGCRVASLRLVSPGAVTDGFTLFYHQLVKK